MKEHSEIDGRAPCFSDVCTGSGLSRRRFLQSAGGCFAVSLAVLGIGTAEAAALPVFATSGEPNGGEHRYPVPTSDSVNIDRSTQVIIARFQGRVYAFALACPHENAAVKWLPKDHRFQCTKHDSQYQPDGVYTSGHATRNLDRYVIRRDDNAVVIDLHKWVQSDKDPSGWASASVAV